MPKVSVVIPVFGVEQYIERCARSLFEQSLDDIEYLFIDDCSPDKSVEVLKKVLDEYPKRKSQVVIHHMEHNSGQAAVRRWGIENAKGEYITHCDSDDWLSLDAFEICYNLAISNGMDIVFFDFYRTNGEECHRLSRNIPNTIDEVLGGTISGKIMGSLWGCIIRNAIASKPDFFPVANYTEDCCLMIQYILKAHNISYINKPLYYYYSNSSSITSNNKILDKSLAIFIQGIENTNLIIAFLREKGLDIKYKYEIQEMKLRRLVILREFRKCAKVKKLVKTTYPEIWPSCLFNNKINYTDKLSYLFMRCGR